MPIVLADGTSQTKLTCLGQVTFDGRSEAGLIIIEWQNTQVLVGMEFLRRFEKRLIVDPVSNTVEIVNADPPAAPPKKQA